MAEPARDAGGRLQVLFERHASVVYGLCRLLLRTPAEAEDAAQQTFLSAHRALLAGAVPRDEAAWLSAIARNECRARLRRPEALPLFDDLIAAGDSSFETATRSEEIDELKAALRDLPDRQREAVVLRDVLGLAPGEIAVALSTTRPSVEALLFRARRRLQGRLRTFRGAAPGVFLPESIRSGLEASVPGFAASGGTAGAVAAGTGLAKLGSPAAAKLAAAALAVGTVGTAGTPEIVREADRAPVAAAAARPAAPAVVPPRTVAARRERSEAGGRAEVEAIDRSGRSEEREGDGHEEVEEREDEHGGSSGPSTSRERAPAPATTAREEDDEPTDRSGKGGGGAADETEHGDELELEADVEDDADETED